MKRNLKKIARTVWTSSIYASALLALDQAAGRVAGIRAIPRHGEYSILIAPSGKGNIGDQAMFDAFIANTEGTIYAIFSRENALIIPETDRDRVRTLALPRLIRGMPIQRLRDVYVFARLLRGASHLHVPGADTIDGGHPHASLARINLLHMAKRADVPATVEGFSWAPDVPKAVADAMRSAGEWASLYPRDPLSYRRLVASDIRCTQAADMVFSYRVTRDLYPELEAYLAEREEAGARVVLFNTSGLIARKIDLQSDYRKVVEHLHARGLNIIFTPHVIRDGDNDLNQSRLVFEAAGAEGDFLIEELLRPAQVKNLASRAFMSITGRMHLAIMSLSHGTPVMTMATAGKVEGLYEFFDLARLVVEPKHGCFEAIAANIDYVVDNRDVVHEQIEATLPMIRELSAHNFGR